MHLKPKYCEVGEDERQDSCDLVAVLKRERGIVYVQYAEEGTDIYLGKVIILVTGKSSHIAR